MKKLVFILLCFLSTEIAFAIPFQPPVVTITGQDITDWNGGEVEITFTLEGRACTVYLAVYTRDMAGQITYAKGSSLVSGLEYHEVAGIDTCVWVSYEGAFSEGIAEPVNRNETLFLSV